MMELQKRKLIQMILGFFLGRVSLFGIGPVGIAFFASGYMETGICIPLGISVLLGMITVFPLETVLCHAMVMAAVLFMIDLLEKRTVHIQKWYVVLFLFLALVVMTLFRVSFFPYDSTWKFSVVTEGVLAVAATGILYEGQHFLLERKKGQYPGNEELLSLVILGMFTALGMPQNSFLYLVPVRLAIYFFILVIGYCYGTGAGALAGAVGGLCLLTVEDQTVMVGVMAVMGILAGLLRNQRKAVLCIGFFWGIVFCSFFIGPGEFPYTDFVNVGLAGATFFFVPERIFGKVKLHGGRWEDYWESEKLQELLTYKLQDFSESFYHLSAVLGQEDFFEGEGYMDKVSEVLSATSELVCENCEKAGCCAGYAALMKTEAVSEISVSMEAGGLGAYAFPKDFYEECTRQDQFLWEANGKLHLVNAMQSFQNQINYHRKAIAEQMKEIGESIGELSDQMPGVWKLPAETREELKRELRCIRVKTGEMAFYEKHDGRVIIYMTGRTSRGRCVTTREVEEIFSRVLKRQMRVLEKCRKVFPVEMEEFIFVETSQIKADTGVSRKSGGKGKISGDTFSCMRVSESEFLLALSDGMGSGEEAYTESEKVIELIERMTEAGFSEKSAVKLINSLYVTGEQSSSFATADITFLNLYQKTAHFIKCGASTTYLYHEGKLLAIEGEALPIGIMSGMEPYTAKCSINKGDYVIMMTDGVSDSFSADTEELEKKMMHYAKSGSCAQDFSEKLLHTAVSICGGEPKDDMSVLVVKLY